MTSRLASAVSMFAIWLVGCQGAPAAGEDERVEAPFEARGEAEDLLLVWYDGEGPHTASRRSDIPEAHRSFVRVDDLSLPPEQRGDPDYVWVADLAQAGEGGSYPIRRMRRDAVDARVGAREPEPEPPSATAQARTEHADVILYGASWCSACRSTAAFFRERNIDFVERDIERDPGARTAMMQAAQAAGLRPTGIPVIDFRGRIITGFDRGALERAIRETQGSQQAPI